MVGSPLPQRPCNLGGEPGPSLFYSTEEPELISREGLAIGSGSPWNPQHPAWLGLLTQPVRGTLCSEKKGSCTPALRSWGAESLPLLIKGWLIKCTPEIFCWVGLGAHTLRGDLGAAPLSLGHPGSHWWVTSCTGVLGFSAQCAVGGCFLRHTLTAVRVLLLSACLPERPSQLPFSPVPVTPTGPEASLSSKH